MLWSTYGKNCEVWERGELPETADWWNTWPSLSVRNSGVQAFSRQAEKPHQKNQTPSRPPDQITWYRQCWLSGGVSWQMYCVCKILVSPPYQVSISAEASGKSSCFHSLSPSDCAWWDSRKEQILGVRLRCHLCLLSRPCLLVVVLKEKFLKLRVQDQRHVWIPESEIIFFWENAVLPVRVRCLTSNCGCHVISHLKLNTKWMMFWEKNKSWGFIVLVVLWSHWKEKLICCLLILLAETDWRVKWFCI